jgi:hypothetical protein
MLKSDSSSNGDALASESITRSNSQDQQLKRPTQETKNAYPPLSLPEYSLQQTYGYGLQGMRDSQFNIDQPSLYDEGLGGFDMEEWMRLDGERMQEGDFWRREHNQ